MELREAHAMRAATGIARSARLDPSRGIRIRLHITLLLFPRQPQELPLFLSRIDELHHMWHTDTLVGITEKTQIHCKTFTRFVIGSCPTDDFLLECIWENLHTTGEEHICRSSLSEAHRA